MPPNVEKIARFPGGEKGAESCHVSAVMVFFGPGQREILRGVRGKKLGPLRLRQREPKLRFELPLFSREKGPNSEERGIYTNPS